MAAIATEHHQICWTDAIDLKTAQRFLPADTVAADRMSDGAGAPWTVSGTVDLVPHAQAISILDDAAVTKYAAALPRQQRFQHRIGGIAYRRADDPADAIGLFDPAVVNEKMLGLS